MGPHVSVLVLKRGMKVDNFHIKDVVKQWQSFLYGYFTDTEEIEKEFVIDGIFGSVTESYTIKFQNKHCLDGDGIVGPRTIAEAVKHGYGQFVDTDVDKFGPSYPVKPATICALTVQQKHQIFGKIEYKRLTNGPSRESIKITNDWQKNNLTKIIIPQLKGIHGAPADGSVFCNKGVAQPMLDLWQVWEDEGLINRVETWAGMWVPRLVRGSSVTLSSHAWGTAFDINAVWNMIGSRPALVGEKGSVRELAEIAMKMGWFWGGDGSWARPDGMHFEYTKPSY